ncbi:hypothetical protein [Anaeromyxobacter oryzae]|uniref:Uncharacterized protein n=1 Tax=Anaeromyxobacter oryzae TaxID=2918170 RepID=A0ABM7WQF9_9BACT|nr:hypothetical protein [Anaeromyxobacter oryzae]BDG01690.1 hypothetical protein AMOR_06860 [Anaeromyxobacter oryzae]
MPEPSPSEWLSVSEWQARTGMPLAPGAPVKSVEIWRCVFAVGYSSVTAETWTYHAVYVSRTPLKGAPSWCTEGFIFNSNPNDELEPVVDIARHPYLPAIVYAYSTHSWASNLPPNSITIRQVSVVNGETLHLSGLLPYFLFDGDIYRRGGAALESVALDAFGTLTVTGQKSGAFDGEVGSGPYFTATYAGFLFDPAPGPVPSSVVAHE